MQPQHKALPPLPSRDRSTEFLLLGSPVTLSLWTTERLDEMSNSNHEILAQAIKQKRQISAHYDGSYRELCPHALGWKNGTLMLLSLQFSGETNDGELDLDPERNWKCMSVYKLFDVTILEGTNWYTASNHSRPSSCIDPGSLEAVVDYEDLAEGGS